MDKLSISTAVLALGAAVLGLSWAFTTNKRARKPLPPGPKPLPFIGNLLDFPQEKPAQVFAQWGREYSDVLHLSLLGTHILVLNSAEAVADLLERRVTWQGRVRSIMADELMGFGEWAFIVQNYGPEWRRSRKLFHSVVNQGVIPRYEPLQVRSARAFLKCLRENPSGFYSAARKHVGYNILDVAYGIDNDKKDYLLELAEEVMHMFGLSCEPGQFFVDEIPFCEYIPSWVPGANFQRLAKRTRWLVDEVRNVAMKEIHQAMAKGEAKASMATALMEHANDTDAANAATHAYVAGSDTTVGAVLTFLLAMCNYPEVQAKAQAEIDAVVGQDRLPDLNDRANLPYCTAIALEALRWLPVLPLGGDHCTTEDDEYKGYFIPKGTIVFGNIWAILHNPEEFPDPEEFIPERFLKPMTQGKWELDKSVRDPMTVAFGFGRRICPGRHLAEQSLFATIISVLAAYSIEQPLDEEGKRCPQKVDIKRGIFAHPIPFNCTIKPRSARAAELIDLPLPERGM